MYQDSWYTLTNARTVPFLLRELGDAASLELRLNVVSIYIYMYNTSTTYHPGLNFASGGADKIVIIWTSDPPDGHLKYTHADSVQCIAFNPVSQQLVSCTASEIGKHYMYVHVHESSSLTWMGPNQHLLAPQTHNPFFPSD